MAGITNRLGWGIAGALAVALLAALGGVIYAGPLAPPASPAATGPTQIFSIPAGGLVISTPGSYIVEADLNGPAGFTGITITATGVTLDLNGFSLIGPAGTADAAIVANTGEAVTVVNGTIRDWGGWAFTNGAGPGGANIDRVVIDHDGLLGTGAVNLYRGAITNCTVTRSGGAAAAVFLTDSSMTNCAVTNGAGLSEGIQAQGSTLDTVTVHGFAGSTGILCGTSTITNSIADNNRSGFTAGDCVITHCRASGNTLEGISVSVNNTVADSDFSSQAGGNGMNVGGSNNRITGTTASSNPGSGINVSGPGNTVDGNTVSNNVAHGLVVSGDRNSVTGNTVSGSTSLAAHGIFVAGNNNTVANNSVSGNKLDGVHVEVLPGGTGVSGGGNILDGNNIVGNGQAGNGANFWAGTAPVGKPNVITRNVILNPVNANYYFGVNNDVGPIGTVATATSPWTNIVQ